jgi:hypothetical protein
MQTRKARSSVSKRSPHDPVSKGLSSLCTSSLPVR